MGRASRRKRAAREKVDTVLRQRAWVDRWLSSHGLDPKLFHREVAQINALLASKYRPVRTPSAIGEVCA